MGAMSEREHAPTERPIGQGDKYTMVKLLLLQVKRVSVEEWITTGRRQGLSYYALADELNDLFREEYGINDVPRITHESIRRWDPEGSFQRTGGRGQAASDADGAADAATAPPVQFLPPERTTE